MMMLIRSAQLLLKQAGHLSLTQLQQLNITELSQLCPQLPNKVVQVYLYCINTAVK